MYAYDLLSFVAPANGADGARCRRATPGDADAMLAIEEESFEYPWTRDEFEFCLNFSRCEAVVVEREEKVVGYAIYEKRRNSIRLMSCAVAPEERRNGLGTILFGFLETQLDSRRSEIVCVVRERNLPAQLFLRNLGFRAQWISRRFYSGVREDAYRMTFRLEEHAAAGTAPALRAG